MRLVQIRNRICSITLIGIKLMFSLYRNSFFRRICRHDVAVHSLWRGAILLLKRHACPAQSIRFIASNKPVLNKILKDSHKPRVTRNDRNLINIAAVSLPIPKAVEMAD